MTRVECSLEETDLLFIHSIKWLTYITEVQDIYYAIKNRSSSKRGYVSSLRPLGHS